MSKTVVINLGNGDVNNGFQRVTAQLWTAGNPHPEQFIGGLPPAPELVELYRNWQSIYRSLCDRKQLRSGLEEDDDQLEIEEGCITNVSVIGFDETCQQLQKSISNWLSSADFFNIERQLRSALRTSEEIRVIVETNDEFLRRLPWHRCQFFRDYPQAEMALSQPEYKRRETSTLEIKRNLVRILAILGNSQGIDFETEIQFFQSFSDAEVVFLLNPTRAEFHRQLWNDAGWDMLFFAGHSQTEGETGRIYINENTTNNSLTIEQLEEALKAAIDKGLKLALFNSCDGLGLASALEKLHIPTVIVMREPVPNRVAEEFFKHFLTAFAFERFPLYLAVQQARRKLQGLEDEFPGASWLPVICQNPATEPPTWLRLGGIPPCPYRGLFAFSESDANVFFGREEFSADLVAAVQTKPMVAVVGPSGSGKSSVVFAGLVPSLRLRAQGKTPPIIISFRPGNNPFAALVDAIAPLLTSPLTPLLLGEGNVPLFPAREGGQGGVRSLLEELEIALREDNQALYKIIESLVQQNFGTRLVLIADQFEELYTLALEEERQAFLDALLFAVALAPAFTLVITLRADFYGHALSYRPFSDALQGSVHNLGPMSRRELQSAIEQPAAQMQVQLEEGLTSRLINSSWGNPGHLPLLEFALTQLWSKQTDGWLTHAAHNEIGGVESAVANHAEAVYAQLSEADRLRAQRVFMQLVQPSAATDARRLATRNEVKPENWDLVTQLASSRLVVTNRNESTGEETVEIVHEALIRSWGRLGYWMQCDGDFRCAQEHLRASIRQWETSARDEGALLRGKPLCDAEYWLSERQAELSSAEIYFIQQSLALRERENQKLKRRRQLTISGLTAGLVLALSLAGVAVWQGQSSAKSEIKAISATSEALFASHQEFDALIESLKALTKLNRLLGHLLFQRFDQQTVALQEQVGSLLRQAVYKVRERNRLEGHQDAVNSVSFSPDGKLIATASSDKTVKLWSRDGKLLQTLTGHNEAVTSVSFSPDGKQIATASSDKTVILWSRDGKLLQTLTGHHDGVVNVSFSPDGQQIATASSDKTVKLWSRDGKLLQTLTGHHEGVNSVSFSPDSNLIATTSWDKTVKLWSRDGKLLQTLTGHHEGVISASFSPDGKLIATASYDKTVKLWSRDGKLLQSFLGHDDAVNGVSFSPNGQQIATASSDKTVKLWSRDGKLLDTFFGHNNKVFGAVFSPVREASPEGIGQQIATASSDKTVKLWSRDSRYIKTLSGHGDVVFGVTYSPNGEILATTSKDKTVKLWTKDGKQLQTLQGHGNSVNSVSFSPDGKQIATVSSDKTAKIWSLDGKLLQTLTGHSGVVNGVSFSPDSKLIATASWDKTVKLWSRDGKPLQTLRGHSGGVNKVSFSPDGKLIATASYDKTAKIWSREGKPLQTLYGHSGGVNSISFSADGKLIATTSWDNTAKIWSRDGKILQTLKGHSGSVNSVSFSADGRLIATASSDKTVKIWRWDGKQLQTLPGFSGEVYAVSFSPNSHTLAIASGDRNVILWNLDLQDLNQLLQRSCDWARDYLQNNPNVSDSDRHLCPR